MRGIPGSTCQGDQGEARATRGAGRFKALLGALAPCGGIRTGALLELNPPSVDAGGHPLMPACCCCRDVGERELMVSRPSLRIASWILALGRAVS
jgi:hypothetical protein